MRSHKAAPFVGTVKWHPGAIFHFARYPVATCVMNMVATV